MTKLNPALAAAFANIEKWEAEQAAHDSSPASHDEPMPWENDLADEQSDEAPEADLDGVFNRALEKPYRAMPQDYGCETWDEVREQNLACDAEIEQSIAKMRQIKVKGLDEKAVLVTVKRSMYRPYKTDEAETDAYGAGRVNKHLFNTKDNRVKRATAAYTEVYTFVNDNTVPWSTGVRMLNIMNYLTFTTGLRQRMDDAQRAVDDLVANWDYEVQQDLARLRQVEIDKGKTGLADPDDYPTADEVQARFGIEVRYLPVPTAGDFRVEISDEDKQSLQDQLKDAEQAAARHVVEEMLEPMGRAVDKLAVPIGQDGSIFRDSLIDNLVETAERMERINVSDDPDLAERIADLKALVATYAGNKDMLRSAPTVRAKAKSQIEDLMAKVGGLV